MGNKDPIFIGAKRVQPNDLGNILFLGVENIALTQKFRNLWNNIWLIIIILYNKKKFNSLNSFIIIG